MRLLTTEEYLQEEKNWWKVFNQYSNELAELTVKYENVRDSEWTENLIKKYEDEYYQLRDKYIGYTNLFDADFKCHLTQDNVDLFSNINKEEVRENLSLLNKSITIDDELSGILKAISFSNGYIHYEIEIPSGDIIYVDKLK